MNKTIDSSRGKHEVSRKDMQTVLRHPDSEHDKLVKRMRNAIDSGHEEELIEAVEGKKERPGKRRLIGRVGIDSGMIMIMDPSHAFSEEEELQRFERICEAVARHTGHPNELDIPTHDNEGVGRIIAASTGQGDGLYPVYAEFKNKRLARLVIEFEEK